MAEVNILSLNVRGFNDEKRDEKGFTGFSFRSQNCPDWPKIANLR